MKLHRAISVAKGHKGQVSGRKVATAVAAAALLGVGATAHADITAFTPAAYAESELLVSNFKFLDTLTGDSLGLLVGTSITNLTATVSTTLSSAINGSGPSAATTIDPLPSGAGFNLQTAAGPNSGNYTAYTSYAVGAMGAGVFAGSASEHSGNGLQLNGAGPTVAKTQAQVNINGAGAFGNSASRQTLGTDFTLTIAAPAGGIDATVSFDADAFLRIALGQPGIEAKATRTWGLLVTPKGSLVNLLEWSPDGLAGGIGGSCTSIPGACAELADTFDLNMNPTLQSVADLSTGFQSGAFGLRVFLPNGDYTVSLFHTTTADASAPIPTPGTLALVGAGLLGLSRLRRRNQ